MHKSQDSLRTRRARRDGAAGYLRRSDHVAVSLARRIPRTMHFGARLATRGAQPAWARPALVGWTWPPRAPLRPRELARAIGRRPHSAASANSTSRSK
jgi:hypothetical protein